MVEILPFLVFVIPILALLLGGFVEWLKFKTKQQELRASTQETDEALSALRAEFEAQQKRLTQRIEHLEAIVTSEDWDLLEAGDRKPRTLDVPNDDLTDEHRAARLARRTKAQ